MMEQKIRTFIALKIIPDTRFLQLYSSLKESLKEDSIKWVDNTNFHLTLHFLGDTTFNQVKEIKHALEAIALQFNPFHFNLKGIGYFKHNGKPSILYTKIDESVTLKRMANEINKHVIVSGFEKDNREFNPHLTLGRIKYIKAKDNFYSLIQKLDETEIQIVKVSEIIFYKSILSSSGPVYKPLQTIQLKL